MTEIDLGSVAKPLSLQGVSSAVARGEMNACELVEGALARIAECDHEVQAWVHVDPVGARNAARRLDRTSRIGPLHGIPIAIKDIIDVAGMPTGCGSALRAGVVADNDAWIVRWLRDQGAIILGKTVTTEFAYFAPGPTRNPRNLAHTPGGSSSGSAAAVAAGMVPLAVGTQTAASTTRPASYCGTASLVTTPGWGSTAGIAGLSHSLDSIGFLVAQGTDLAALFSTQTTIAPPKLRVWCPAGVSADMRDAMDRATSALSRCGASIRPLPFDHRAVEAYADHAMIMAFEAAQTLAADLLDKEISAPLRNLLEDGTKLTTAQVQAAHDRVRNLRSWLHSALDEDAAILVPAALDAAPRGQSSTGDPVMSRPWQVAGWPTAAIPGLTDPGGLPLGVQLVTTPHTEHRLAALAGWVQLALNGARPRV